MMKLLLSVFFATLLQAQHASPTTADLNALFQQLDQTSTAVVAANALESAGSEDENTRNYIATHLPSVLKPGISVTVWQSKASLAGRLKLTNCIPQLIDALVQGDAAGPVTRSKLQHLENDPAARALIQIGDPAVPSVAALLASENREIRSRSIMVLINIDSPLARSALSSHYSSESNETLKRVIHNYLERQ